MDEPSTRGFDISGCLYVPVLDDSFHPDETLAAQSKLKADKASGPDGLNPGAVKLLPLGWIIYITALFSIILQLGAEVRAWKFSKLVSIFKKGVRTTCSNYRGIAISNALFKMFDLMLYNRLTLWFRPCREQTGGQRNRGCLEQILTLRLLIDYCRSKRKKLHINYVDYSKAYDRVPRT